MEKTGESKNIQDILEDEAIRKIVAIPRKIPRNIREEIAEIVIQEIVFWEDYDIKDINRFIKKYGAFYLIFFMLKGSEEWKELKEIGRKNQFASILALKLILPKIFDMIDEFSRYDLELQKRMGEDLKNLLEEFKKLIEETLELWGRNVTDKAGDKPDNVSIDQLLMAIKDFQGKENSGELLNVLIETIFQPQISEFIKEISKRLDSLELLSLLFPGRYWDYSLKALHKIYLENIEKYSKIIEKNEDLKKILELIGRIELEYGSKRLAISSFGTSDVYSVSISKDMQHVLPVEFVKIQDSTLKNLFFSNLIEGKLLTYQLKGLSWVGGPPKKKRKGPVVALVDTSGSMSGSPEIVAKSIVLAMAKKMLNEKRDVKVILFSSTDRTKLIELTNKKKMAQEFLDFLNYSFGGGTDFNTALRTGLNSLNDCFKNADLLFITDGLSVISEVPLIEEWKKLKNENDSRIFSIIVGNNNAGGLEHLSDSIFILKGKEWSSSCSPANMIRLVSS